MKNYILFLLIFPLCLQGQTNEMIITYKVIAKQSKVKEADKDIFYLIRHQNKSLFISKNKVINDSIFSIYFNSKARRSNGHIYIDNEDPLMKKADKFKNKYKIIIEKDFKNKQYRYQQHAFMSALQYTADLPKFKWRLLPETKTYLGYKLKKANLDYKGRHYTAWYAPSVPVSDGPYKFYGLPGLIFEIKDEKGEYIFKLVGIEYKKVEFPKKTFSKNSSFFHIYQTTEQNFYRDFWKTFNPANILGSTVVIGEGSEDYKRERVEKIKSLYNNPIEIDEK